MDVDELPALLYLYPNVDTSYCAGVMSKTRSFDPYLPVFFSQGKVFLPHDLPLGSIIAIVVASGSDGTVSNEDYYRVQMMGELARRMGYRIASVVDESRKPRNGEEAIATAYREQLPNIFLRGFFPVIRLMCRSIMRLVRGIAANGW